MDKRCTKIVVFCCSTTIDSSDLYDADGAFPQDGLKVIAVPCSGKVNIPYLVKAFEGGADGVMVVTCKKEECQYMHGSFRAGNRVQAVDALINEIGLGQGRIVLTSLDNGGVDGVIEQIREFRDRLNAMPLPGVESVKS